MDLALKWFNLGKDLAGDAAGEVAKEATLPVVALGGIVLAGGAILASTCGPFPMAFCASGPFMLLGWLGIGLGVVVLVAGIMLYFVGRALPQAVKNTPLPSIPLAMRRDTVEYIAPGLVQQNPADPGGPVVVDMFALGDKAIDNAVGAVARVVSRMLLFQAPAPPPTPPQQPPLPPPRYARAAEAAPEPPAAEAREDAERKK